MPRIVYLSWPAHEISGGIKAIFQHVALLAEAGVDAAVATEDGKAPEWFRIAAPLITLDAVQPDDVLVFPENSPKLFQHFEGSGHRKLVFCQNPYYAWQGLAGKTSYAAWGVSGVLCPSVTVMQFCRQRLPDLPAWFTPFYIDERLFVPGAKTLQIACIPRKRPMEMGAIHDLFCATHPEYAWVTWQVLQGATERQVADVLGRSAVYLGLARLEAHGMTSLEAMACGCVVAGFTGVAGGTDSATAGNGFWVPEDDVHACVDKLFEAVRVAERGGAVYEEMVRQAGKTAANYRREEASKLLLVFWRGWLRG